MAALDATLAQEDAAWEGVRDYIFGRGTPDADLRTNYWSDALAAVASVSDPVGPVLLVEDMRCYSDSYGYIDDHVLDGSVEGCA